VERRPAVFYVHPWEIDPEQPRIRASFASRVRHYTNLDRTEPRLRRMLAEFQFAPLGQILEDSMNGNAFETSRRVSAP
jgi:hypothetical protein